MASSALFTWRPLTIAAMLVGLLAIPRALEAQDRERGPNRGRGGADRVGTDTPNRQTAASTRSTPATHPRLVVGPEDLAGLRAAAQTPDGKAIRKRLEDALTTEPDGISIGSYAAGHALLYFLDQDPKQAQEARRFVERVFAGVPFHDSPPLWNSDYKMIYRTKAAVDVALAYDLCFDAWDAGFRKTVAGQLDRKSREFTKGGGKGFNNKPGSNWLGNTQAAGGLLALAVVGDPGAGDDIPKVIEQARRGFADYLAEAYGDRGWCAEGFNYLRYPMTTSGFQFLAALTRASGKDMVTGTPAEWLTPLYVMQMVPRDDGPYVPFFGLNYPFTGKDVSGFEMLYERTRWRSGDLAMGIASTPAKYRPAVQWMLQSAFGPAGDKSHDVYKPADAIYALAAHAGRVEARNPAEALPLALEDKTLGYYVFRNRWKDQDDFVAAFQMNLRPRSGTYSFQDAGSFRFYGLGTRWAEQGSRKDRDWKAGISRTLENVVQMEGANGWPGGRRLSAQLAKDGGGIVNVDLSPAYAGGNSLSDVKPSGVKAMRSFAVDYSGRCGAPALLIVADQLSGGGEKTWTMHTAAKPTVTGNVFTLAGADGASLQATVIAPASAKITVHEGKETHAIAIPGDGEFLVVMTVQREKKAPQVQFAGTGLSAKVRVGPVDVSFDGKTLVLGP